MDERVESQTYPAGSAGQALDFGTYATLEPRWGDSLFAMEIEVRAYADSKLGPYARAYTHQVVVVNEGREIISDQFELCPKEDLACHQQRDANAPDNVVARRAILEWKAQRDGLMQTSTRSLGRCAGGDQLAGNFAKSCTVYRESTDTELSYKVDAELNFELNVNGKAAGRTGCRSGVSPFPGR